MQHQLLRRTIVVDFLMDFYRIIIPPRHLLLFEGKVYHHRKKKLKSNYRKMVSYLLYIAVDMFPKGSCLHTKSEATVAKRS